MEIIRNLNPGEEAVALVRIKPSFSGRSVDFTDYTNPRITAVIPCVKTEGRLIAIATGKEVIGGKNDEERSIRRGTAFHYPDGSEIILTRNGKGKQFFVPKTANNTCVLYPAFGK